MISTIEMIGYIAGIFTAIALLPQVIKAWKTKSVKDISLLWNSIYLIGLILWLVYGFGINSRPLIIFVVIELVLALSLIILKFKYSDRTEKS